MAKATFLPEDRPLTEQETALVRWMLENGNAGASRFLQQLRFAWVVSRCPCGCASIDFSIDGVTPAPGPLGVLADFVFLTEQGHLCGAFVFERDGLLAGLEVWSVDGLSTASTLPTIEQLQAISDGP